MELPISRANAILGPVMARAKRFRSQGTDHPGALGSAPDSPARFGPFHLLSGDSIEPDELPEWARDRSLRVPEDREGKRTLLTRAMPNIARSMIGIVRSASTLRHNPAEPRTRISRAELGELERRARRLGADLIGYTDVLPSEVFADQRVLSRHAIVLAMEMDEAKMATAPHIDAFGEVQQVYADLGLTAFKIARHLQKAGFAAEAGPALGGDSVYPPQAQRAGLGWVGRNGLLLTEEFGPRVRLAVVYTSIENLPVSTEPHERFRWMRDFCDTCGACVRRCPPGAILDEATVHDSGRLTHVENSRCYPYFEANYGCGVCIKVCPFSHVDVEHLRSAFERRHLDDERAAELETLVRIPERHRSASTAVTVDG